ncbi:adenosine deaminase [Kitasatospora sp. GAS204A]|uniref:adenosine deaminase family protein n=1 Tax=unclassified Kitasatospora TaxID=2633591 RepID=UPI002475D299|nr:adenosine deaminase [Kitasatospora sp. GAS204B]MDH6119344.1 adenosine deaminase [Kitasatospora sp. GAS204B]
MTTYPNRRRAWIPLLLGAALALSPLAPTAAFGRPTDPPVDAAVSRYLASIQDRPEALDAFFRDLPKGGDLHNHLSGAASTELLLQLAVEQGLCIDSTDTAQQPPCAAGTRPAADTSTDPAFRQEVIRAWSMQDFVPGAESGHDHFFATFGKFGAATYPHTGRLLAEVANRAAEQHQYYLETMITPASSGAAALAAKVGWDPDLAALRDKLLADHQIADLVTQASGDLDRMFAEQRDVSHCGTPQATPGCALPIRIISQASRGTAPERVFTQLLLGMELARHDNRFVAVNLVQPEDGPVALRDYELQMGMLDYLHGQYPEAHITLHAGELAPGLVKPEDLRFHIRQAVEKGQAERIGHGVDLGHEDDPDGLLRTMVERHVLVEVPLTSNAQILNVMGADHPFPRYLAAGVPVALATDDQGVERIDISHEYRRAAETYGLDYRTLKRLSRTSIEYGFLPGASIWRDGDVFRLAPECAGERPGNRHPRADCAALLAGSPKAAAQWQEEAGFAAFERHVLRK